MTKDSYIMPIFGKRNKFAADSNTDDQAWSAARSSDVVRTVSPIFRFTAPSEGDIRSMQEKVKKRLEESKRWDQWLKLHAQWEAIDSQDTQALAAYKAELAKILTEKQVALAARDVAIEKQRLPVARAAQTLIETRAAVDQQIAELRSKQQQIAADRGWGRVQSNGAAAPATNGAMQK